MCGITGIWAFNEVGRCNLTNLEKSTKSLSHRGPDHHGTFDDYFVGLGHRRLSIIDTSANGNQPMQTPNGRFVLTFNGEIYNYQELRRSLESKGISFQSDSDSEVLLQLYAHEGKNCLQKLNGFFAFAIYDSQEKSLFIARDRMGIKPLLYFQDEFKFAFASEMQAILAYGIEKQLDQEALQYYLQLNYTPAPLTMMKGVKKLLPGHCIEVKAGTVSIEKYYDLPPKETVDHQISYDGAQKKLAAIMEESIQRRLIADVPVGTFLSGGIDSSVITAIASKHTDHLKTFSIGFKGASFFDETKYAELVAKKYATDHTVFWLADEEISENIDRIIDHFDEPFADSSALPVYLLCQKTRGHIKVALSGDGADEIFSGYNKHAAWWNMDHNNVFNRLVRIAAPIAKMFPKSRSGILGNIGRQVLKYAETQPLPVRERYWRLAGISSESEVDKLMIESQESDQNKRDWLSALENYEDINDLLRADTRLVLPNDMLKKVDMMSMANGLEVRVPFLDHEVVDFVFKLPVEFKINKKMRKRLLQDTYRELLPRELYNRSKKGFEMPLLHWLKNSLKGDLQKYLFDREKIESQGLFEWEEIAQLKRQLYSISPGDSHARVWALYIFQKWYRKHFSLGN